MALPPLVVPGIRPEDMDKAQPSFPLNAHACLECGLIAVADQIPEGFFSHYLYVPSGAATMHSHFDSFADVIAERAEGGLVVDIGSNDGLLLAACNARGCFIRRSFRNLSCRF